MKVIPAFDLDRTELFIFAFPLFVGLVPSRWRREPKNCAMHRVATATFVGTRRAPQFAIRFDAKKQVAINLLGLLEKRTAAEFAVEQAQRAPRQLLGQQRANVFELPGQLGRGRRFSSDALVQQRQEPTPRSFRHHAERAVTVSDGDRLLPFDRRRVMDERAILERPRLNPSPGRVIAHQQWTLKPRQMLEFEFEQVRRVEFSIL